MYSQRSTIFKEALNFQKVFFEKNSRTNVLENMFAQYLQELALILEKSTNKHTIDEYSHISKKFFYGMIAGLLNDQSLSLLEAFLRKQKQMLEHRKKILIITIRAGHGHTSAAKAILAGMHEKYGYDAEIVFKELPVDLNTFYETTVKHTPKLYQWMFESTDSKEGMALVHGFGYPMFAGKLDAIIEEENPDVIVSTYSFPGINHWIKRSLRQMKKYIPFVTVITDSISIHEMWYGKDVDYYIVANEETKEAVVEKGYAKTKVKVLGFPVHPKFFHSLSKEEARQSLHIHTEKQVFLMSVGTGSKLKDVAWVKDFHQKCGKHAKLIMILANNEDLFQKLEKMNLGDNVTLLKWVDNMYAYMKAADVIITKAGGATVMECIAARRPMIITKVLPGQEQGNAELINKYHIGVIMEKNQNILDVIEKIAKDKNELSQFDSGFAKATITEGTFAICGFLQKILKN